ncbi:MAG TPA: hypothetical protein VMT15_09115 [Bryobacteraceae bacterium]|nr:hypothetical protein [Bryobacteraceae bacterium]
MALLERLAHGIKAGILGALALLSLFASTSILRRHVWWEVPNLLGSTFYHYRAFYSGVGTATVAGAALELVLGGVVGGVFGAACGNVRSRHRLILLGTLTGLAWFYLANLLLWPRLNPMVPLYWPEPAAVLCHAVFGACLAFAASEGPELPAQMAPRMR